MKALVLTKADTWPIYTDYTPVRQASDEQVEMHYSAINHRDLWIAKGQYAAIKYPYVPGSDGMGIWDGKKVIINPSLDWGDNQRVQGRNYRILGLPDDGTFAEQLFIKKKYIYDKPEHLSDEEAAALPLAGLTAYRALFVKANPAKKEKILISGIGGGVALLVLKFALAFRLEVYVSSGSDNKIERAIELGAAGGVNYHDQNWRKKLSAQTGGGLDIVIDGAGGIGVSHFVKLCNPCGRIILYGGTQGKIDELIVQQIFWKQLQILGTTMGSEKDFEDMLDFVKRHKIHPVVDKVFKLDEGEAAFTRMDESKQFGKIVFKNKF